MSLNLLLLTFLSFLFSFGLLKMIVPYLIKNVIDKPNQRSSHKSPKPSAGGLSFVISGVVISIFAGNFFPITCLPLALVGFIDDLTNLKRSFRFSAQIITVLLIIFSSKFIDNFGEVKSIYFNDKNILDSKVKDFDMVLTFRNTHNWLSSNTAENVYKSIHKIMKKGAILGVVQHRADEKSEYDYKNGYVKQSFLIEFIESQGFKFISKSEINANPKDTKNYEKGVWTLPPRLILGDKNKNKFLLIGESDRMTLKFIKP